MENRQSALKNIITRNLPGINLLQVSVVEDENADQYKSKYFAFLKGVPSEQSQDSSTGRTYNYRSAINLKMEAEKLAAMASALRICAEGKYEAYEKNFGQFEIYADSSRSGYGGEGSKKNVRVGVMKNNKSGKFVIAISFMAGDNKATSFLTPYDAFGFAKILDLCSEKIIELESTKNMGFSVSKQQPAAVNTPSNTGNSGGFPATNQGEQPVGGVEQQNATDEFKSMFEGNGMASIDEPPF